MSSYVVSDETISTIVNFLHLKAMGSDIYFNPQYTFEDSPYDISQPVSAKALAEDMFALNVEAVEQRYGEGEAQKFRPLNFKYEFALASNPRKAYKELSSWRYQCCEGDVPETDLFKLMDQVYDALAHSIVQSSN